MSFGSVKIDESFSFLEIGIKLTIALPLDVGVPAGNSYAFIE